MSRQRQFLALTRHFFDRFFDVDSVSAGADLHTGVIQMLAMLAVPGLMFSFYRRFGDGWVATADHYFYVSYSMTAMGFVMVLKWDSLFPDRRDYLALGSLPISYSELFLAKVIALG